VLQSLRARDVGALVECWVVVGVGFGVVAIGGVVVGVAEKTEGRRRARVRWCWRGGCVVGARRARGIWCCVVGRRTVGTLSPLL